MDKENIYLDYAANTLTYLKEQGYEIDIVNITKDGKVDLENLKSLIRTDTILVSVCYKYSR